MLSTQMVLQTMLLVKLLDRVVFEIAIPSLGMDPLSPSWGMAVLHMGFPLIKSLEISYWVYAVLRDTNVRLQVAFYMQPIGS